ncbi:MAG: alpha-amylase family glycosyl hydrolase [Deferribacterota bacterium]|nr:alpha-amylase family glycosyl hydrolase [Deferribacterota bacterium]
MYKPKYFLDFPNYRKKIPEISPKIVNKMINYLSILYGSKIANKYIYELIRLLKVHFAYKSDELEEFEANFDKSKLFSEKDIILITYGDIIVSKDKNPLSTICTFADNYLKDIYSTIHILPFFPYSSDRGFAITDFKHVNPDLGTWRDIYKLNNNFNLMFDFVMNHVSSKSKWFQEYLNGHPFYKYFFTQFSTKNILSDEQLKLIVRPRTSDLFTEFATIEGIKLVWTTFSSDQIDLNYKNVDVLMKMINTLLYYIRNGADIIRLDAVTYLWETLGTNCTHLKQTHIIIKLIRLILEIAAPYVLIITETNVPHEDNIKYFGNGYDEAHMVYNFPLPPLVLYTYLKEDSTKLTNWAINLDFPSDEATYFNILDTHDGVGLFPVNEILNENDINFLVLKTLEHGGYISYRKDYNDKEAPYELNITWYSALNNENNKEDTNTQIKRYLSSRAIALSFRGIPGIYIHGLFGSKNDSEAVLIEKETRSINRKVLDEQALINKIESKGSVTNLIFNNLEKLLTIRRNEPLFHPNNEQKILNLSKDFFILIRYNSSSNIICVYNITNSNTKINIPLKNIPNPSNKWLNILDNKEIQSSNSYIELTAKPYDYFWLKGC